MLSWALLTSLSLLLGLQAQPPRQTSGGSQFVSPSVLASSSSLRVDGGPFTVEILILWRGSPGWMFRRTGMGSSSGGAGGSRRGVIPFNEVQGGFQLTAEYDRTSQSAIVLGDRVELKGANVIFVDKVDSPDGPVVAGTFTLPPSSDPKASLPALLRDTPQLLSYLRCNAQIPEPYNLSAIQTVCGEAMLRGLEKAPRTETPIPTNTVVNRASMTAPLPRPEREVPAGATSEGSGVLSPAVVGGWFTTQVGDGTATLDLLILWRGSVGWFATPGASSGSSGGGSSSGRRTMNVRRGDRSFSVVLDPNARSVEKDGKTLQLANNNVLLIDEVDSPAGSKVTKMMRIDPALPDSRRIDIAISRSTEVVTYLRCDAKMPDEKQQAMMNLLCARYGK